MPGRRGSLGTNGQWNGTGGSSGLLTNLSVATRSLNTPAEYKATIDIEFVQEFVSGEGDSFEAFITTDDGSGTGDGVALDGSGYRYGFNGKENDNEVEGEGNQQDYGMRIYDPRLGKFLSVDPLTQTYPWYTPYQFAGNKPIEATDLDGAEENNASTYVHRPNPVTIPPKVFIQERQILMADIYGTGQIGPQSYIESKVRAIKQNYYRGIGENIRGGPGGAIGYLIGGDRGSYLGATVDNVGYAFGGVTKNSSVLSRPYIIQPWKYTPVTEAPVSSPARQMLARALKIQGLEVPPQNFKQKWVEGGYDYEVRIHSADAKAPAGSNSGTGTTFIVSRRMQGKNAQGQGFGWERADDKGRWYKESDLKADKNPQASNDTHIPLKPK